MAASKTFRSVNKASVDVARKAEDRKDRVLRHAIRSCFVLIAVCFGGLGWWLHSSRLDSAAVAPGILENAALTKIVQHLEGGIVAEIYVRDGQVVEQGELLLRLDPTRSEASVDLFNVQLLGSKAKQARLSAEVDLGEELTFPEVLIEGAVGNPEITKLLSDESRQFALSRKSLEQAQDLLETQITQARAEIEGLELRRDVAQRALVLVEADLEAQLTLLERGLTSQPKVTAMLRDKFSLEEKIAQSDIDIARTNQSISGLELQIRQQVEAYRQRAAKELDEVNREIRGLQRDLIVTSDSLNRIEVRAPVSGTVQESILGTVGAIIRPGETIMKIVPSSNNYIITAKIKPNDIESILPGLSAQISFPAFQSIEMKPAEGKLMAISRDRIVDVRTGENYYEAEVHMLAETVPEEVESRLVAGMAVSVILPTGKRTALEYVLTPVLRRWRSAMREE